MTDRHEGTKKSTPHPGWGDVRSKTITWHDPMVNADTATSLGGALPSSAASGTEGSPRPRWRA